MRALVRGIHLTGVGREQAGETEGAMVVAAGAIADLIAEIAASRAPE